MLFLAAIGMVVSPLPPISSRCCLIRSSILVRPLGAFGLHWSHHRVLGIFRHLQVSAALRLRVSSGIRWQTLQRVHQSTPRMRNLHAALDDT